jgi:hypothetical protein
VPKDLPSAQALFTRNPFDFERWAVSLLNGQPNDKQVGDKGVDGRIKFDAGPDQIGLAAVSVKGGRQINPSMVRDLLGTMEQAKADMGILVTMLAKSPGMQEVADKSGTYVHPTTGHRFPRVQLLTVVELLKGTPPEMPTVYLSYIKAAFAPGSEALPLF